MKLIDFGIGPIWNEISRAATARVLLPTTIAFLAEFVPNSFKNQSNDEISIEKLDNNLSSYQKDYLLTSRKISFKIKNVSAKECIL